MRKLASILALCLAVSLAVSACGASTTNTNTSESTSQVRVVREAFTITTARGFVIAMNADGLITINGEGIGTLHDDGRVTNAGGEPLGALISDGRISFGGELSPLRITGNELFRGEARIITVTPGTMTAYSGSGEVSNVPVVGGNEQNTRTVLFVLGTAFLELSARPQEEPEGPGDEATVEVYRVPVDNAPVRGPADALVTIVTFSDFQCPFCSRVIPTLEQVVATYGNDVRIVFRQNPLPFHPNAGPAAEAALEAYAQRGAQGFWAMHDLLFENQSSLDRADLERYAAQLQLDMPRFRLALDNHVHQAVIAADQALAAQVGASGTPAFFINGRMLMGAQPFESFRTAIDAARTEALVRSANTPRAQLYASIIANGRTSPAPPPAREADPMDDPTRVWDVGTGQGRASRGTPTAPVTIQIFSDFQCPFCARVTGTIDQVLQMYAGRVRVVFRHYPLPFHTWAREAAQASIEVQRQAGDAGFWQFHDLVFENQREIGAASSARAQLVRLVSQVPGVDGRRVELALASGEHDAAVQADMDAIDRAGAQIGTPSFFINGRLIQGAQPLPAFQALIDDVLAPN